jgi:hypothetical protein
MAGRRVRPPPSAQLFDNMPKNRNYTLIIIILAGDSNKKEAPGIGQLRMEIIF